ncbi:aminodeoxychorismate lyase [Corynebacterium sp. 335C]
MTGTSATAPIIVDVLSGDAPAPVDATRPLLYADDLGAVRGDGVFETLLVRDGHTCNTRRHEDRFVNSARVLQLPEPDMGRWREASAVALREWGRPDDASMRWVYTRGRETSGEPTGYVMVSPVTAGAAAARQTGVRVMLAERGFSLDLGSRAPWALIGAKTLSYAANMAALRHAREHGFDDVIFTSAEGNLLEGPTSTIIVVRDGELLTPNPGEGVLPGTTQAALFDLAESRGIACRGAVLTPEDLRSADAVWLVSSVRIAVRVVSVDGDDLAPVDPGEEDRFVALCEDALAAE